jgi:hypothetical protein
MRRLKFFLPWLTKFRFETDVFERVWPPLHCRAIRRSSLLLGFHRYPVSTLLACIGHHLLRSFHSWVVLGMVSCHNLCVAQLQSPWATNLLCLDSGVLWIRERLGFCVKAVRDDNLIGLFLKHSQWPPKAFARLGLRARGCTEYYVWEPRAFMTPLKNPLVYERLYV